MKLYVFKLLHLHLLCALAATMVSSCAVYPFLSQQSLNDAEYKARLKTLFSADAPEIETIRKLNFEAEVSKQSQSYASLKQGLELTRQYYQRLLLEFSTLPPPSDLSQAYQKIRFGLKTLSASASNQAALFPSSREELLIHVREKRHRFQALWQLALRPAALSQTVFIKQLSDLKLSVQPTKALLNEPLQSLIGNPPTEDSQIPTGLENRLESMILHLQLSQYKPDSEPNTNIPGIDVLAISELTAFEESANSVYLSWAPLPSDVDLFRIYRKASETGPMDFVGLNWLDRKTQTSWIDSDSRLVANKAYDYALRADSKIAETVACFKSKLVLIPDPASIPAFGLSVPAKDDELLLDELGTGITFSWTDAGTELYYVQIRDAIGVIRWGAITKHTSLQFGTCSGCEKIAGITKAPDPKLMVPKLLSTRLIISKVNPDASLNEVQFQGIQGTGSLRIQVSALKTWPVKGDLAGASSVAIRPAEEVRFWAP